MHAAFVIAIALLASGGAAVAEPPRAVRSTELPRPRDGNIAIQGEFEAARRAGTVAAYDLFIARHPRHALAGVARRERAELLRREPKATDEG